MKAMTKPTFREPTPLGLFPSGLHGGERRLNRLGRSQVKPVFGWEVEEGQQSILIRGQSVDRLGIASAVLFLENGNLLQGDDLLPAIGPDADEHQARQRVLCQADNVVQHRMRRPGRG